MSPHLSVPAVVEAGLTSPACFENGTRGLYSPGWSAVPGILASRLPASEVLRSE